MKRRDFIRAVVLSGLSTQMVPARAQDARLRYRDLYIFDGAGFPTKLDGNYFVDMNTEVIAAMRKAGYGMIQTTVGTIGPGEDLFHKSMEGIDKAKASIARFEEQTVLVTSRDDMTEARRSGRTGVILGFQDTRQLEEKLENLDRFHAAGVRCVQLTYNLDNHAGSGCLSPADNGLTSFGRDVVERLGESGMLLDLSHGSRRTISQALDQTRHSVAITHSGCNSVYAHPRNVTDESLRKLAAKGGVIGIYFMPYLCAEGTARSDDLVAHIEHAINVCGEDCVGIGTDNLTYPTVVDEEYRKMFQENIAERKAAGISAPREDSESYMFIEDLNTDDRFYRLAGILERRGHSASRIEKILGKNFQRLFMETL